MANIFQSPQSQTNTQQLLAFLIHLIFRYRLPLNTLLHVNFHFWKDLFLLLLMFFLLLLLTNA
jgi:hypothetical protein